ncbi:Putative protein FAM10A5 [Tupaia chinensis]|uniref:Hsp70-interacting protein N-terminal domain-containing protein n=1 Tax=Tupaia chinensis TaxID=246437 RepID=L9KCJ8_TUPCH|nr:Putative protein FAM10A5 [Tupaia chinensis]
MDPCTMSELWAFVKMCKQDPSVLHTEEMYFLKEWVEGMGGKVPPATQKAKSEEHIKEEKNRSQMLPFETVTEPLKQTLLQLNLISGEEKLTDFWAIGKKQHMILPLLVNWIMMKMLVPCSKFNQGPRKLQNIGESMSKNMKSERPQKE